MTSIHRAYSDLKGLNERKKKVFLKSNHSFIEFKKSFKNSVCFQRILKDVQTHCQKKITHWEKRHKRMYLHNSCLALPYRSLAVFIISVMRGQTIFVLTYKHSGISTLFSMSQSKAYSHLILRKCHIFSTLMQGKLNASGD